MSEENVEVVRRTWAAFLAGMEHGEFDAWLDSEDIVDDFEWIAADLPGTRATYRGREAFHEFMSTWIEGFETWSVELDRLIDASDDRVVALFHQRATGKRSGVPVELQQGLVYELEDRRVIRMRNYADPDEALKAVGLTEPAMYEESTTPDLVELVRRLSEALFRLDFDAAMSFYAPDAVVEGRASGMTFEGRTAIRGFYEDMTVAYEELEGRSEETLDLGNGVVFGVVRASARPVGSTGRVELRVAIVAVWEEGLIVRGTGYDDIDEARAAAEALAEERAQADV